MAILHLNARFLPLARAPFVEMLNGSMHRLSIAAREVGGGTLLSCAGEPLSCDVELGVDDVGSTLPALISLLQQFALPRGSHLSVDGDTVATFGRTDGVGLYLNGTDLPDDVYAVNDVNVLIDNLVVATGDAVINMAFWHGHRETAIYLYGASADLIVERLAPVIHSEPLAEASRVVILEAF